MRHQRSALLAVIALASACATNRDTPVILVSIDTLRADHLGCYGYPLATSPSIDRFRRDAVLFEHAIAQAPSTLPSHASLLTSLVPPHHGASFARRTALPPVLLTLAEVLRARGWATAAFTDGGQLAPRFGLQQGFQTYKVLNWDRLHRILLRAAHWLDERAGEKFFLFLHTYEPHAPYDAGPEYLRHFERGYRGSLPPVVSDALLGAINRSERSLTPADLAHVVHAYDAQIRSVDEAFGHMLVYLRKRGLYERALIIVTSDHGEELGERGGVGVHSHTLFDELLRVPLLIKLPRGRAAGATVRAQVRSIDIAPTILEALGVPAPAAFEGRSLLALLDGSPARPRESFSARDRVAGFEVYALRTERWKLFGALLFDLAADPEERIDVAARFPAVVADLDQKRRHWLGLRKRPPAVPVRVDPETQARLRALGYLR